MPVRHRGSRNTWCCYNFAPRLAANLHRAGAYILGAAMQSSRSPGEQIALGSDTTNSLDTFPAAYGWSRQ